MCTGEYRGQGLDESGKEQRRVKGEFLGLHVFGTLLASQFFFSEKFHQLRGRASQ